MGVAFAEVSPDFRIYFNTGRHCCVILAAACRICHCDAGCVHARRLGMGAVEWL